MVQITESDEAQWGLNRALIWVEETGKWMGEADKWMGEPVRKPPIGQQARTRPLNQRGLQWGSNGEIPLLGG